MTRVLSYDHGPANNEIIYEKVSLSDNILQNYVGTYIGKNTGEVTVSLDNNQLQLKAGKMESTLYAKSTNTFFHKSAPLTFEFILGDAGMTEKLFVIEKGKVVEELIKQ